MVNPYLFSSNPNPVQDKRLPHLPLTADISASHIPVRSHYSTMSGDARSRSEAEALVTKCEGAGRRVHIPLTWWGDGHLPTHWGDAPPFEGVGDGINRPATAIMDSQG